MGRSIPLFTGLLFAGGLAFLGVAEIINYFKYPTARHYLAPGGADVLTLYDKGQRFRAADVFISPAGGVGAPDYITGLYHTGKDREGRDRTRFEALYWTADGTGLFASVSHGSGRAPQLDVLWFYDLVTDRLYGGYAEDGLMTIQEAALIRELLGNKGGAGPVLTHWYELGKKEGYLPSWKVARWERARSR